MKQALEKHLTNKQTVEDAFKGIGGFLTITVIVRACAPIIREQSILAKWGFVGLIYGLLVLSGYYFAVHVIRPFVKVYYPKFTVPHADSKHRKVKSFRKNLKRPGALLFSLLVVIALYLGASFVIMTLVSAAKTSHL